MSRNSARSRLLMLTIDEGKDDGLIYSRVPKVILSRDTRIAFALISHYAYLFVGPKARNI